MRQTVRTGGYQSAFSVLLLFFTLATGPALADTLRLKDGRVYEGKLVSRDAQKVVFRIVKTNMSYTQEFAAAEVAAVDEGGATTAAPAEAPKEKQSTEKKTAAPHPIETRAGRGAPYYVLPIRGTFGLEVSNAVVNECLHTARELGAKVVVLEIESPGGRVSELKALLDTLDRYSDLRIVAFVKDAKSAAAIFAMSCREIVMADRAQIGAATPFTIGPDGTPQNIEAKFESALRADFRAAVERGQHNPLLAEGMVRDDLELGLQLTPEGGKRVVEGHGDRVLKKRGEILTLTTQQAIECGLALGNSARLSDSRKWLGLDAWFDLTDHGRERVATWIEEIEDAQEKFRAAASHVQSAIIEAQAIAKQGRRQPTADALRRSENWLRRMEELAEKYPALGDDETLKEARDRIKAFRKSLE